MIDKKDKTLLNLLKEDSSLSTYKLSKKTKIPQTTVLNRIKKLKELAIIKKFTIDVDFHKLDRKVKALIFVKVDNTAEKKSSIKVGNLEKKLSNHLSVLNVKRIMGKMDFVVEVIAHDIDELNQFLIKNIRDMNEVIETETIVVLDEFIHDNKIFEIE